jgi:F-type H+-transporting ATPase subunit alpha
MLTFKEYLDKIGEIGTVDQIVHSVCYATGLPHAHPNELVIFENGSIGQVLSLNDDILEILLLDDANVLVGSAIARTGESTYVEVGDNLLGRVINPLGKPLDSLGDIETQQKQILEVKPPGLALRDEVKKPLNTGVALVDMIVPIAKGQRELVIGDRKTGKTQFLLQTILSQSYEGTISIYAMVGQRQSSIERLMTFFKQKNITNNTIIVASGSSDTPGLIFLTPYTAMTIAEYFRDKGLDVLLVIDDLSTHASYYREISLLAKRFPGRSSYPGDIFYIHSRLMERAGNFKKGSITCIPCAETILGDLSGYIQTNIMAMTDGHIFFDVELYNQGRRPAINPFLSVTRVGHQAQTSLQRDISRELLSFLVEYDKMQQFMHFGAEVGDNVKKILDRGEKLLILFNQPSITVLPVNVTLILLGGLWSGIWNDTKVSDIKTQFEQIFLSYNTDPDYRKKADEFISAHKSFNDMINTLRQHDEIIMSKLTQTNLSK